MLRFMRAGFEIKFSDRQEISTIQSIDCEFFRLSKLHFIAG